MIGCFQGGLLFLMLMTDARVGGAGKVLALFCLMLGGAFLLPFLTHGHAPEDTYWLAGWLFFVPVAYGPLLYLYCRLSLLGRRLRRGDLWHALPLLLCYLLSIDTLLLDGEGIRLWIVGSSAPTWRIWFSEYLLFAIALGYAIATVVQIRRFQQQAEDTLSSYNPAIFTWLWTLVWSLLIIWTAKAIMSFAWVAMPNLLVFSDALIVVVIYMIALAQWRNPSLFTIAQLAEADASPRVHAADAKPASEGVLDEPTRARLFEAVRQQVEDKALYRDSELTLAGLAEATGLGVHHLSEVLNQHGGKNFNRFINEYRIEEACRRLRENESDRILDIAMAAGFSSKSTFNTLFRTYTGTTPSQYRQKRSG